MNKSIITFSIILVIFVIGLVAYFKSSDNQLSDESARNFAIENIDQIDKIFLASKDGETITLSKKQDHWLVNNQFIAREDRISTLLETAKKVQTKNRIPKKKVERVIKNLATEHIKAEFYIGEQLHKSYFIGGATQQGEGTYMLQVNPETQENASTPFITYIMGFQGYLTPRYEPAIQNWRDLKIFHFPKNRIKSVELKYPSSPEKSFKIEIKDKKYVVKQNGKIIETTDELIKKYLLNFKTIAAERLVPQEGLGKDIHSKLKASTPYFELTVTDLSDEKNTVIGYKRAAKIGETNAMGMPIQFDPDRLYGICFGGNELTILQYYVFDPLLIGAQYFKLD